MAYFHPDHPKNTTTIPRFTEIYAFYERIKFDPRNKTIIILGDLNIDYNKLKYKHLLNEIYSKCDNQTPLILNTKTQRHGKQLDWCFSNHQSYKSLTAVEAIKYESYFSDHNPLWVSLYNS